MVNICRFLYEFPMLADFSATRIRDAKMMRIRPDPDPHHTLPAATKKLFQSDCITHCATLVWYVGKRRTVLWYTGILICGNSGCYPGGRVLLFGSPSFISFLFFAYQRVLA